MSKYNTANGVSANYLLNHGTSAEEFIKYVQSLPSVNEAGNNSGLYREWIENPDNLRAVEEFFAMRQGINGGDFDSYINSLYARRSQLEQGSDEFLDLNEQITKWEELRDNYNADVYDTYRDYNKTLASIGVSSAVTASGQKLTDLSEYDLKQLGAEGIRQLVTEAIAQEGGFEGFGLGSENADNLITEAIKSNEKLYSILQGDSYTLNEVLGLENNEELLQQFSQALRIPMEQLKDMGDVIGNLKLGDLLEGLESLRTQCEKLGSFLTDLTSSGGLSSENLETIINEYPELAPLTGDTEALTTALLSNMQAYSYAYERGVWNDLIGSAGMFNTLKDQLSDNTLAQLFGTGSKFANATSLKDLMPLLYQGSSMTQAERKAQFGVDLTNEEYQELLDKVQKQFTVTYKDIMQETVLEIPMQYLDKLYEKQLNNLESQKSALEDITSQREYENKLIEAKLKLENAQKEKKRVWREGVGWVYESDQAAIKEAQDNLDSVTNEKTIAKLEEQITQLNAEKDRLSEIQENKEFENLQDAFNAWEESLGQMFDSQSSVVTTLENLYNNINKATNPEGELSGENQLETDAFAALFTGSESLWGKLQQAKAALEKPSDFEGSDADWYSSDAYYQAQENYNNALSNYQTGVKNYESNYGSSKIESMRTGTDATAQQQISVYDQGSSAQVNNDIASVTIGNSRFRLGDGPVSYPENEANSYIDTLNTSSNRDVMQYATIPEGLSSLNQLTWNTIPDSALKQGGSLGLEQYFLDKGFSTGTLLKQSDTGNELVYINTKDADKYPWLKDKQTGFYQFEQFAKGTLNSPEGLAMLNEEGSEVIVTPNGTLTSLPSRTGVVPADITKNLWQLGSIAPSLLRWLGTTNDYSVNGVSNFAGSTDNSLNIANFTMKVDADSSFDIDAFVGELKTALSLSKNNKR